MSTTIDQRVVEMRFDNQHFEKNVSTTMSTLDKLKQKLNLSGASKGLEGIDSAAKKVDMRGLGMGVDSVSAKFSALQVMGVTALANITNSAINAGKNIVNALTIAPIKDGFQEYEMTLNAVQTTMAGTGKTAAEVQKELKKLDEYADKTVYSTADMLNNLPKFTNAGVELETATTAMIGIANATALAGGDASKASIAFYNLGQAIGTGYLTRMDYNSINNAGIATMEWKEQMIEAALAAGTLSKAGDNLYKAGNKTFTMQQLFIDGLQHQWATTDVMLKVFDDYGKESTKIGKKAYAAAQDIKTFTMMMDSLKATAGTGWKDTWQLIFGDLEQAKGLWTGLSNFISNIITKMADFRNGILEGAMGSPFGKLAEKLNSVTAPIEKVTESLKDYEEIADRIWKGEFGEGQKRWDKLSEMGYDWAKAQNIVNKRLGVSVRHTEQIEENQKSQNESQAVTLEQLTKMSDAQLKKLGFTKDEVDAFRNLEKQADKAGIKMEDLVKDMEQLSGRNLLINSFKNIGKVIVDVCSTIKEAWNEVFHDGASDEEIISKRAEQLYGLIAALHKATVALKDFIINDGELTENGDKLLRTFEGLFAILDIIATVVSGPIKLAFNIATKVIKLLGLSVLDITAGIGDAIVKFRNTVDKITGTITDFIAERIAGWIDKFKETEFFKTCADWFEEASQTISDAITNISDRIENFKTTTLSQKLRSVYDYFAEIGRKLSSLNLFGNAKIGISGAFTSLWKSLTNIGNSVKNSKIFNTVVDAVCNAFSKLRDNLPKFKLPEFNLDNFKKFVTDLTKIGGKIASSGKEGIFGTISGIGSHLKDNVLTFNWNKFKNASLEKFWTFWLKTGDKIKAAFDICKDVVKSIVKFIFGAEEVNLPVILSLAEKFLAIMVLIKTLNLLNGIVQPIDNLTSAFDNIAGSFKWNAIASAFKAMALALGVLSVCIVVIASMPDMNKAWQAVGMLAALMGVMGVIALGMAALSKNIDGGVNMLSTAASLLMIIAAVSLLVFTIKEADKLNLNNIGQTFLILAGVILTMTAGVRMISKAAGASFGSVAAILTLVGALKLILDVIKAYDEFDWVGKGVAIQRMMEMLVGLSVAINIASRGVKSGASAKGLAMLLLVMVISLKMLIDVIEQFAAMDTQVLLKGGFVVTVLLTIMTIMASELAAANQGMKLEKGQRSVNNFAGLAMALLAVVAAIWLLGKMPIETLEQGGRAVAQILLLFTGLLFAVGKSCSGLKVWPIVIMLLGFALIMAEMAIIMKRLDGTPWQNSLASAGALSMLIMAMAFAMMTLTKYDVSSGNIFKWVGAMATLGLVLAELAIVLHFMKGINPANALANATALSVLLGTMALSMKTLTKYDVSSGNLYKWVGAIAVLGLVVAGLAFILKSMTGTEDAIKNASALAILAVALSAAMIPLAFAGNLFTGKGMLKSITSLAAMTAILGVLVYGLSKITGIENARANAETLANLAIALSVCTIPLAVAGLIAPTANTGVLLLVALAATLGLLVWHLSTITGIDTARENAITLSNLAIVLSLCTIPLAVAGLIAPGAIVGATLLAALAIVLGLLVWGLSAIKDTNTARTNTETISILLESIAEMIVKIGSLGVHALTAMAALSILITLITRVGALAVAIGLLTGNGRLIDKGLSMLQRISEGLGEIISSFALGLTSKLPEIADNLSAFVEKAAPFVELVKGIGDDVSSGATNLAKAILVFLAADFVAGIADMLDMSLADLGADLSNFADNISGFISAMDSMKPETVSGVEMLCSALSALTGANLKDAITQLLPGDNSLTNFGTNISAFATCIKDAAAALKEITDEDVANIKRSATAGEALASLNRAIPAQGGWAQKIAGEKELATFGQSIVAFADCLVNYSAAVSGKNIDAEAITNSASAAQALSDLNSSLPRQGGWAQTIAGEKELTTFGQSIVAFADCLIDYSAKVSESSLNPDAIIRSAEAADALATLNGKLPSQNGLWQAVAGEKDMGEFGIRLVSFAKGLVAYAEAAAQIDDTKLTAITNSGTAVDELVKVVNKVPTSGGWGEAIFGSNDGQSFGAALYSLANGIMSYCDMAAAINDDSITAITNTGNAIDALSAVMEKVPETSGSEKTAAFVVAVSDLKSIGSNINSLTTSEYDYSGLEPFKEAISTAASIFNSVDGTNMASQFANVKTAVNDAQNTANTLQDLNGYTYGGIARFKDALKSLGEADLDSVISSIAGRGNDMAAAMKSLTSAMVNGLKDGTAGVSDALSSLVSKALEATKSKNGEFGDTGKALVSKLAEGVKNGGMSVVAAIKAVLLNVITAVKSCYSGMYTGGQYLGDGLISGINSKKSAAYWAGYALGQAAAQGEKDGQKSASPSKLTIQAGKWLGEGLIIGMNQMTNSVYNAGHSMGRNAIESISDSVSKISDVVMSDMDTQPTIRPVLDLSDIRAGAGMIGSLLNADTSMGVMTNLNSISTMMNRRGQNGGTSEVVSAIDKLRKDLGNVGNTSYNINGITYDRGSELDDALRTIVRYAKIEGRV